MESLDTPRTQACLADLRKLRASIEQSPTPQVITNEIAHRLGKQFPYCRWFGIVRCWLCSIGFSNRKVIRVAPRHVGIVENRPKRLRLSMQIALGGFVAWEMGTLPDGQDSKAVEIAPLEHWPSLRAVILVVSDDKKDTPSTTGMQSTVATSDLFAHRIAEVVPKGSRP